MYPNYKIWKAVVSNTIIAVSSNLKIFENHINHFLEGGNYFFWKLRYNKNFDRMMSSIYFKMGNSLFIFNIIYILNLFDKSEI